jgi:hypothetical protein
MCPLLARDSTAVQWRDEFRRRVVEVLRELCLFPGTAWGRVPRGCVGRVVIRGPIDDRRDDEPSHG